MCEARCEVGFKPYCLFILIILFNLEWRRVEGRILEDLKFPHVGHSPLLPFCSHHVKESNGLSHK